MGDPILFEQIKEELRTDDLREIVGSDGDVNTLAQYAITAKSQKGAEFELPAELGDELRQEIFSRLGVPKEPSEYEISTEGLPEGTTWDESSLTAIRTAAKEEGISGKALTRLMETYKTMLKDGLEARDTNLKNSRDEATKALQKLWGNRVEANTKIKAAALDRFASPAAAAVLAQAKLPDGSNLADHPEFTYFLFNIGSAMQNDGGLLRPPNDTPAPTLGTQEQFAKDVYNSPAMKDLREKQNARG